MTKQVDQGMRMGITQDLLALLRRPIQAPAPAPHGKRQAPPPEQPATEAEIVAALDRAAEERRLAYSTIDRAGERREALLLIDGSDDEIAALAREVDRAQLLLERLDRLEPDLRNRLRAIRDAARIARWIALRDEYIRAGLRHVEELRRTALDRRDADEAWASVTREFPRAREILPVFPFIDADAADRLERELDRLATLTFDPHPRTQHAMRSVAAVLADPQVNAETFPGLGGFGGVEAQPFAHIKLKVPKQDLDGRWLKIGTIIRVSGFEAATEAAAGRAEILHEQEAA
jgi:hypothetical protein